MKTQTKLVRPPTAVNDPAVGGADFPASIKSALEARDRAIVERDELIEQLRDANASIAENYLLGRLEIENLQEQNRSMAEELARTHAELDAWRDSNAAKARGLGPEGMH